MGGSIRVGVRLSSGKEYIWNRWTNSLPYFLMDPKFLHEDKEVIKEFCTPKKGKFIITENRKTVSLDGYGVVLIDFIAKEILSIQGYCSFKKGSVSFPDDLSEKGKFIAQLHKDGMIKNFYMRDTHYEKPVSKEAFNKIIDACNGKGTFNEHFLCEYQSYDFKVIDMNDSYDENGDFVDSNIKAVKDFLKRNKWKAKYRK